MSRTLGALSCSSLCLQVQNAQRCGYLRQSQHAAGFAFTSLVVINVNVHVGFVLPCRCVLWRIRPSSSGSRSSLPQSSSPDSAPSCRRRYCYFRYHPQLHRRLTPSSSLASSSTTPSPTLLFLLLPRT
ncbi:hypothetical protein GALMADRAFT_1130155 [Galerina marginata CBS 339.88]|uniref:Uncharacterized protein n=1 Tax=Galerina marginata (strain CBS 339.88) TaxID=685588 RepID=A0A067SHG0_GALM3|nr:hypothetical protein GALMADRAFT_1130155 [Galerina marginata CBS 339.88]